MTYAPSSYIAQATDFIGLWRIPLHYSCLVAFASPQQYPGERFERNADLPQIFPLKQH